MDASPTLDMVSLCFAAVGVFYGDYVVVGMYPGRDVASVASAGTWFDPQSKPLAPKWDALTTKADTLVTERRTVDRTLGRARAKLSVFDAQWDPEIAAFARDVHDQSGGKRDQAPNTRFFKDVNASTAQSFGIDREVQQGQEWTAELHRNPAEPLATKWIPRLESVTNALAAGSASRRNALQACALQDTTEELFIADVNREIDILEGELLKLFPGQPKRVAAFLEATRPAPRRSSRETETETG